MPDLMFVTEPREREIAGELLTPLLQAHGNDPRLRVVLHTLDEAGATIVDLAYRLPKKIFRLGEGRRW